MTKKTIEFIKMLDTGKSQKQQGMLPLWSKGNHVFEEVKFKYG